MRLGNALSEDVLAVVQQKRSADSGACQGTGTWSRTFQDLDGNGVVSSGDLITVQFLGCLSHWPESQTAEPV